MMLFIEEPNRSETILALQETTKKDERLNKSLEKTFVMEEIEVSPVKMQEQVDPNVTEDIPQKQKPRVFAKLKKIRFKNPFKFKRDSNVMDFGGGVRGQILGYCIDGENLDSDKNSIDDVCSPPHCTEEDYREAFLNSLREEQKEEQIKVLKKDPRWEEKAPRVKVSFKHAKEIYSKMSQIDRIDGRYKQSIGKTTGNQRDGVRAPSGSFHSI